MMIPQNAIPHLEHILNTWAVGLENDAIETAIKALKTATPEKPTGQVDLKAMIYGTCPVCGSRVISDYNFCPDCGKALNWL